MDLCRKFMSWSRGDSHDQHTTEKEDTMTYREEDPQNIDADVANAIGVSDETDTPFVDEPATYHDEVSYNEENDVPENEEADITTGLQFDAEIMAQNAVDFLKMGHQAAAVYNYIITEVMPVAPDTPQLVIEKLDEIIPLCENAEESYRLDLSRLSIPFAPKSPENTFRTLRRKAYALKYLLEDHQGV